MKILKALLAGAAGTTFMTLFSYGSSRLRKKQFREPELLAHLIAGPEGPYRGDDLAKGWLAHYLVGAAFSLSYLQFFQGKYIQNPFAKGALFGGLYGIAGAAGWKASFSAHPAPPQTDYKAYYAHLILAHILLAHILFGTLAFALPEHQSTAKPKKKSYKINRSSLNKVKTKFKFLYPKS